MIKLTFCLIFFVVSYSQCNVLTGHHCVLEIIWSVISWYLYHLSFQENMEVLNFFLCVYLSLPWLFVLWNTIGPIRLICALALVGNRSNSSSLIEIPKEYKTDLWLSRISTFVSVVGRALPSELSIPIFFLSSSLCNVIYTQKRYC